ncbi:M14 family zinc carboxypeptidase [Gynuella sp.]|uniref:M14 family zinc carboxypeptidase n=1 Tax=Gynuella sp. TaxID=2969146 RepID=UPI003D0FBCF6
MQVIHHTIPNSSIGTHRELIEYQFNTTQSAPVVFIQAGLHADEWPGILTIQHLVPLLEQLEADNKLIANFRILPYANPIGLDQHFYGYTLGRLNRENGQNFNRGFQLDLESLAETLKPQLSTDRNQNKQRIRAAILQQVSELPEVTELQCLHKLILSISLQADYVLDLHCDKKALGHIYSSDHLQDTGKQLASCLDFPVYILEDVLEQNAFDGVHVQPWIWLQKQFTEYDIPLACFSATVELRGKADVNDTLADMDSQNLIQFLINQELIAGSKQFRDVQLQISRLEQIDVVTNTTPGFINYTCQPGDAVQKGEKIAEIILIDNDKANQRIPVVAGTTGLLFGIHDLALVRKGEVVAMIAGTETVRDAKQISD